MGMQLLQLHKSRHKRQVNGKIKRQLYHMIGHSKVEGQGKNYMFYADITKRQMQ